jgi:hypothetical protein
MSAHSKKECFKCGMESVEYGMGSATVPVAVFGVPPETFSQTE